MKLDHKAQIKDTGPTKSGSHGASIIEDTESASSAALQVDTGVFNFSTFWIILIK